MRLAQWYVAVTAMLSGVSTVLFWIAASVRRTTTGLAAGRPDFSWHIGAEYVTGTVLAAGGLAMIVTSAASWSVRLACIGYGLLLYALLESPGHYLATGQRKQAMLLGVTLLGIAPAMVVAAIAA